MYRIGEFSKLAKTTVKTLRYYEKEGLLSPAYVDESLYRYYTSGQLLTLAKIMHLRQCGCSIEEIRAVLSGEDIREILQKRRAELEVTLSQYHAELSKINFLLEEKQMQYEVILKTLPECIVYCKEGRLRDFSEVTDFILSSANECLATNPDIKCAEPDYSFSCYTDPEFKPTDFGYRYCQAVTKMGVPNATIRFEKLPETKAVCIYHKGPYADIGDAYAFALKYVEDNGYEIADLMRERYIDGVWNKDDPADYLTEIQIPVK